MSKLLAVLGGLLLSIAGAVAPTAQTPSDQPFLMQALGAGVWAAITNPNAKAGSVANAGFVIGDDGVIVIDTAPNAGKALLAEIRQRTKRPGAGAADRLLEERADRHPVVATSQRERTDALAVNVEQGIRSGNLSTDRSRQLELEKSGRDCDGGAGLHHSRRNPSETRQVR